MKNDAPRTLDLLVGLLAPDPGPETIAAAERGAPVAVLATLSAVGLALYGAAAGLFQGGTQVLLSAAKAPLLVLLVLALTLPSLAVSTALAGARWTGRRLLHASLFFVAALALMLSGVLPVAWLFSVSSRHLVSPILVHLLAWSMAVLIARRAPRAFLPAAARAAFRWWTLLFLIVSLQATTFLQPVLYRAPGEAALPRPRQLFLSHLAEAARIVLPERASAREASRPSGPRSDP